MKEEVLRRYLQSAGNVNSINGTYVTVGWNNTRWQVSESDEPIGNRALFGSTRLPTYEMPTQLKPLEWAVDHSGRQLHMLSVSTGIILAHVHILGSTKGPEVRDRIVGAYHYLYEAGLSSLKENGQEREAVALEKVWPKVRKKLVWKKVD
jgi:hypothetical protein